MDTIGTKAPSNTASTDATRSAGRVAVLLVLLLAAAVSLRGRIPDPQAATPRDPNAADSPASLVGVIALLGVAVVVMAFAVFHRRPPKPKPVPWEMTDYAGAERGRMTMRTVLICLGFAVFWLVLFLVFNQFNADVDLGEQPGPPTAVPEVAGAEPPVSVPSRPDTPSPVYQALIVTTVILLAMMAVSTVLAAVRHRSMLPPVVLTGAPEADADSGDASLALAAERGLAEVANPALAPREAIIACYAAMEKALAGAPGAAPQASDTPTEVLARAVAHRIVRADRASTLVDLFAEARFSSHLMTEDHRHIAEQALRSVLGEVRGLR